jgi:hypothetical protein
MIPAETGSSPQSEHPVELARKRNGVQADILRSVRGVLYGAGIGYFSALLHGQSENKLRWMIALGVVGGLFLPVHHRLEDWSKQQLIRKLIREAILAAIVVAGYTVAAGWAQDGILWTVTAGAILVAVWVAVVGFISAVFNTIRRRGRPQKTAEEKRGRLEHRAEQTAPADRRRD